MIQRRTVLKALALLPGLGALRALGETPAPERWRALVSAAAYRVLFEEATERPYSSPLNDEKGQGTYHCAACYAPLFASEFKYDSGTGWPSFFQPVSQDAVAEKADNSLFVRRTEVVCNNCGAHLGHVFPDGPPPTGLRYCMNGTALRLEAAADID